MRQESIRSTLLLALFLFFMCFIMLLITVVPTIYTLDSAEFTIGAKTLGIVHAPGYPLYLMVGHIFSWLPFGDVGYRLNLLSGACLAFTAPFLYALVNNLIQDHAISAGTALVFVWSYYVWTNGIVAEIYAPQVFTLTLCGWWLARMYHRQQTDRRDAIIAGVLFGVAVAMHPSSILFAPGIITVFLLLRIPWRFCFLAAGSGILVVLATLSYLPIRYTAQPPFNMAGWYNPDGTFHRVDLTSVHGLWWMLRGQQFKGMFFTNGLFPSMDQVGTFANWLGGNFLGIGALLGVLGAYALAKNKPGIFLAWLGCFLPFSFFYMNYGAPDVHTMLGPSYLMWAVAMAFGWQWATESSDHRLKIGSAIVLPVVFLGVNFPLIHAGSTTEVRVRSEAILEQIPPDAAVFGVWWDIVPLQYLQIVEHKREDLSLYNLFQLDLNRLPLYLDGPMIQPDQPVIMISQLGLRYLDETQYHFLPLWGNENNERQKTIGGYRIVRQDAH